MAYHGGIRPFAATFFVFSDYMRPAVRLASLNKQHVVYVWTHDSVGLGEDGPTHQPVEHLMSLRAMPNLHIVRPADANETIAAWRHAMTRTGGPVGLVLSRQDLPVVTSPGAPGAERGAYVLADFPALERGQAEPSHGGGGSDVTLIATGSEVAVALAAREQLAAGGISARVVSMPCWDLFAEQDAAYRDSVLPPVAPRVSVEAGTTFGWREWVGSHGACVGIDRFGASAPGEILLAELGITASAVVAAAHRVLGR
jgi:transketolase